jgi:hypothetical protein
MRQLFPGQIWPESGGSLYTPGHRIGDELPQLWAGRILDAPMKRLHVYLSDEQFDALKVEAERQGVSSSRLIRSTLPGADTVRDYQPYGRHSEKARIGEILANMPR